MVDFETKFGGDKAASSNTVDKEQVILIQFRYGKPNRINIPLMKRNKTQ